MSRAKLVDKLRIPVGERRRISNPEGPPGRLMRMRQVVTALVKHERIELNYHLGDESRGYAERLISEAIQHGDKHIETMDAASYWLLEKQLVHKLFKVLAPRYANCKQSYTKMWKAPYTYPGLRHEKCVLELRDNIYPELGPKYCHQYLLHNMLLDEARKAYEAKIGINASEKNVEADVSEKLNESSEENLSLKVEQHNNNSDNNTKL